MNDKNEMMLKTINYCQDFFKDDKTGHDWQHIHRVYLLANHIAKEENADDFVVGMSALLHDLDDWKLSENYVEGQCPKANLWLTELGIDEETKSQILYIIDNVSFKGAHVKTNMATLEGKVVQDADRLDALGAIGIARAIIYGAVHDRALFDPEIKHQLHYDFKTYQNAKSTTINHFHEKILLLKDRMQTKTGKKLAEKRHRLAELYIDEFYEEWFFGQETTQ